MAPGGTGWISGGCGGIVCGTGCGGGVATTGVGAGFAASVVTAAETAGETGVASADGASGEGVTDAFSAGGDSGLGRGLRVLRKISGQEIPKFESSLPQTALCCD